MIPITQTIKSDIEKGIHGNCFASCLASIMEIPLSEVPEFQNMGTDWFPKLWDFLLEHGYEFYGTGKKEDVEKYNKGIDGFYIVNGESPRGFARGHSVVYYKGEFVHDPYPDGKGLTNIWNYYIIEPIRES